MLSQRHLLFRWSLFLAVVTFASSFSPNLGGDLGISTLLLPSGPSEHRRTVRDLQDRRNRDGHFPNYPPLAVLSLKASSIVAAHEVLRKGLQQFLELQDTDLGTYLSYLINHRTEPFIDEYGQIIRVYKKVFRFIWEQYNETIVQNYAVSQFDRDKLELCSVARYLWHQPVVSDRRSIMKRMGDALGYMCHPCTPYTPKQYDVTIVPSTDGIDPDGITPEESLILCKGYGVDHHGDRILSNISTTSTPSIITTTFRPFTRSRQPSVSTTTTRTTLRPCSTTQDYLPKVLKCINWGQYIERTSLLRIPSGMSLLPSGFTPGKSYYLGFGYPVTKYQNCANSGGLKGHCSFLEHCARPENIISLEAFLAHACPIGNDYIGVCCPEIIPETKTTSTFRPTTTAEAPITANPSINTGNIDQLLESYHSSSNNYGLSEDTLKRINHANSLFDGLSRPAAEGSAAPLRLSSSGSGFFGKEFTDIFNNQEWFRNAASSLLPQSFLQTESNTNNRG